MKLTFLGTGTSQGVPVIGCTCTVCTSADIKNKRLRCAALVEHHDIKFLIDCGPDIRQQLLKANISRLDGVVLTHEHYDHIGGLDDLRPIIFKQHQPAKIYAQIDVIQQIKIKYHYAFVPQSYPGAPKFDLIEAKSGEPFFIHDLKVYPFKVKHGDLDILGYKFNDHLAYITDSNGLNETTLHTILKVPVLVINALHQRPHHSHYTLDQTLSQIQHIQPGTAYLIHMSHYMGLNELVQATLPPNVFLAYDTLTVEIPAT